MSEFTIAVGRIIKAHGVYGECLAEIYGDSLSKIKLPWDVELHKKTGEIYPTRIVAIRAIQKSMLLMTLFGLDTREKVRIWHGALILVPEESLPPLAPDEVRQYELEGALLEDSKGKLLGKVTEVFPTKSESVLTVVTESDQEVLVPFSKEIITSFIRGRDELKLKLSAEVDWESFVNQEE